MVHHFGSPDHNILPSLRVNIIDAPYIRVKTDVSVRIWFGILFLSLRLAAVSDQVGGVGRGGLQHGLADGGPGGGRRLGGGDLLRRGRGVHGRGHAAAGTG